MEQFSADRELLIETMIQVTEKDILKMTQSVYQNDSYSYAINDNFRVPSFQPQKPNILLKS